MKTKTIVLTGGTGFFGKFLVRNLLKTNTKIVLLVRANSQDEANKRIKKLLNTNSSSSNKITILSCDLSQEKLGLSPSDLIDLENNTTHILHAAASTRFTLPLNEARRNNVETTKNLLSFAKSCSNLHRFGFISTAYIAGKRKGIILENDFKHKEGFLNTYEESKYEAESIVRAEIEQLPIVIFRPSLIITPLKKSGNSPVNALTLGLFLARKVFLPILPGKASDKLDIIEAELASNAIIKIFLKESVNNLTYQITSANNAPTLEDLIALVEKKFNKKLPIRFCGDIEEYTFELKKVTRFRPDLIAIYKKTQSFLPELAYPKIFDNSNLLVELNLDSFSKRHIQGVKSLLN